MKVVYALEFLLCSIFPKRQIWLLLWGWESCIWLPENQPSVGNRFYPKRRLSEALQTSHVVVPLSCHSLLACSMFLSPLERHIEKWNDWNLMWQPTSFHNKKQNKTCQWIAKTKLPFTGSDNLKCMCFCSFLTIWCWHTGDVMQTTVFFPSETEL